MFKSQLALWILPIAWVLSINPSQAQVDEPFAVIFDSPAIETSGRVLIEQEGPCFDFPGGRSCQLKLAGVSIQKHGKNISLFQSNITISPADNDEYIAITGLGKDASFGVRAFIPGGGCIDNTEIPNREKFREILSKADIFVICDEDDDPSPGTAEIEGSSEEPFIFDLPRIDFGIVPLGFAHFRQISGTNTSQQTRTLLLTDDLGEFSAYQDLGDGRRGEMIEVLEVPPGPFSFIGAYRPNQFNLNRQITLSELEKDRVVDIVVRGSSPPIQPGVDAIVRAKINRAIHFARIKAGKPGEDLEIDTDIDVDDLKEVGDHVYLEIDVPTPVTPVPGEDPICDIDDRIDAIIAQREIEWRLQATLECWTGDFLKPVTFIYKDLEKEEEVEFGVKVFVVNPNGDVHGFDDLRTRTLLALAHDGDEIRLTEDDDDFFQSHLNPENRVTAIAEAALFADQEDTVFITIDPINDAPINSLGAEVFRADDDVMVDIVEVDRPMLPLKGRGKGPNDPPQVRAWTWQREEGVDYKFVFTNNSSETIRFQFGIVPLSAVQSSSMFLPGDCNRDSSLNMADAICLLSHLFLGDPNRLPCGEGPVTDPANIALFDLNGQAGIDASDAIHLLVHLFLGGAGPVQGSECIVAPGCPNDCG